MKRTPRALMIDDDYSLLAGEAIDDLFAGME